MDKDKVPPIPEGTILQLKASKGGVDIYVEGAPADIGALIGHAVLSYPELGAIIENTMFLVKGYKKTLEKNSNLHN